MDKESDLPDKRFVNYAQVFNSEGVALGFTLPGNDFLFRYDDKGGWKDEKGNYYNSDGVLQKVADGVSDDDDEDELDEQQLDQFQRMLDDEGTSPKKNKKSEPTKKEDPENYQTETNKFLENYTSKKNIRQGLPEQLHIFFKMRTKFFERVKPIVQKTQSVAEANEKVKEIKIRIGQQEKKLRESNKWIGQGQFDFSGAQLDEATYDRYWYGFVKTSAGNYKQILEQIEKSSEFALLEHKTFFALKSKFYLKKKMQETIGKLSEALQNLPEDAIVRVTADNLPQNFPLSFIFDLCSFSDTPIDEVFSIEIIDDFKAEIFMSKKGAAKFVNVQGYCHDDKEFIQLEVEVNKEGRKLEKTGMFKVSLTTNKDNPYKTHVCELQDTLGLQKSREQFTRLFTEEEEKQNGGYRFVVGQKYVKRVAMFRGRSLDVIKVELFVKK